MNRNYGILYEPDSLKALARAQPGTAALELPTRARTLIQMAIRQAQRSNCRHKVGAVIAVGNRVLAASPNLRRNSPRVDFRHATFHAEEAALRRARRTAGATAYVARVNSNGLPLLAEPCPRCHYALWTAGVVRAYFTTNPDRSEEYAGFSAASVLLGTSINTVPSSPIRHCGIQSAK
ncbi:hypothetical protein ABZV60_35835 [Streptomyces sp. NPDC004787]|uniref:hypothetical protein n=1 Tax=Streptomyces sp. NPDC004787 TaxID=3154291 RepID=UPI0033A0E3C9